MGMWRRDCYGALHVGVGSCWLVKSVTTGSLDVQIPWLGVSIHRWRDGKWKRVKVLWMLLLNIKLTKADHGT